MALVRCPTCDKTFDSEESKSMPFCSPRCRQIDLGRWLNEEIAFPAELSDDEDSGPPPENGKGNGNGQGH